MQVGELAAVALFQSEMATSLPGLPLLLGPCLHWFLLACLVLGMGQGLSLFQFTTELKAMRVGKEVLALTILLGAVDPAPRSMELQEEGSQIDGVNLPWSSPSKYTIINNSRSVSHIL